MKKYLITYVLRDIITPKNTIVYWDSLSESNVREFEDTIAPNFRTIINITKLDE